MKTNTKHSDLKLQQKVERLQKLLQTNNYNILVRIYADTKSNGTNNTDLSLRGIKVAIERLKDFWEEQRASWKEIRDISDDEHLPADDFFNEPQGPSYKQSLPTILENDEENLSPLQKEIDSLWSLVNCLKEAENKIIERYKYELKQLAVDLKNSEEKIRNLEQDTSSEELKKQVAISLNLHDKEIAQLEQQLKSAQQNTASAPTKQQLSAKKPQHGHQAQQQPLIPPPPPTQINKSIQTENDGNYYLKLYENERAKLGELERTFAELRNEYNEMQEMLQNQHKSDDDDEDQFKQQLAFDLDGLRNKISLLTDQAAQAEKLLIEKDGRVKELLKQNSQQQQECTSRRAEQAVLIEEKRTLEANLKVIQSINRKLEAENLRLNQNQYKKEEKSRSSTETKKTSPQPANVNKNYQAEIQHLNIENQHLKQQLSQKSKQLLEQSEVQQQERKQLSTSLSEVENLRDRIIEQQHLIEEYQADGNQSEALNEAMEYLEMKDREIEKLRREVDSLRVGNIGKQDHPQGQNRDLQNLLMVMSKQLKEKEEEINYLKKLLINQ